MQVTRVSQNYNQNKTSFKGEAEQKIFMRALKVSNLKNVLHQVASEGNKKPAADYLLDTFLKLKKYFSNIQDISISKEENGGQMFSFKPNKEEEVAVRFFSNTYGVGITYDDKSPFINGVLKNEHIALKQYALNDSPPAFFLHKAIELSTIAKAGREKEQIEVRGIRTLQKLEEKQNEFTLVEPPSYN